MYEAGSPLAFYKHGGRVEFRTTEKKKKKDSVPTIAQKEAWTQGLLIVMQVHLRLGHAVAVSFWLLL